MTRNRDHMSLADMLRVCALSGATILVAMVALGAVMIAQKPEARLELASTPTKDAPVMPAYLALPEGVAGPPATRADLRAL